MGRGRFLTARATEGVVLAAALAAALAAVRVSGAGDPPGRGRCRGVTEVVVTLLELLEMLTEVGAGLWEPSVAGDRERCCVVAPVDR